LVKDQEKLFTYVVDVAEDVHIMYARRDAQLVDMEKLLPLENTIGKPKLFKDKE